MWRALSQLLCSFSVHFAQRSPSFSQLYQMLLPLLCASIPLLFQRCLLFCFLFVLAKNVSLNFCHFINHCLWFGSKLNQNKNLSFFSLRFHKRFHSLFLIYLSPFLLCHLLQHLLPYLVFKSGRPSGPLLSPFFLTKYCLSLVYLL